MCPDDLQNPSGRYELRGVLGTGGLAVVHEAVDRNLQSEIALKTLHSRNASQSIARELLVQEARLTAKLDHPGIVPVHELGVDELGCVLPKGALYFTMKKVEGTTLADHLAGVNKEPRTSRAIFELLQILVRVCDAVAFAHSRGVVHRDIKPANVMIGPFGQVYLMDWGIAMELGTDRRAPFAGTLSYMSPEQARDEAESIDQRSDVFSLGAILYEMLSGRPPYPKEGGAQQLRFQALMCQIRPIREVADWRVPSGLSEITMKALAKEPAHRYATALAFQSDLVEFLHSGWQFPRKSFSPGTRIVTEGDKARAAYVIVQGRCRAYKALDGSSVELREMGEGDVFGETAVFAEQPRTATVEAIDNVIVMEITKDFFLQEEGVGYWMGRFVRALAERFCERDARATELERRLAELTSAPNAPRST